MYGAIQCREKKSSCARYESRSDGNSRSVVWVRRTCVENVPSSAHSVLPIQVFQKSSEKILYRASSLVPSRRLPRNLRPAPIREEREKCGCIYWYEVNSIRRKIPQTEPRSSALERMRRYAADAGRAGSPSRYEDDRRTHRGSDSPFAAVVSPKRSWGNSPLQGKLTARTASDDADAGAGLPPSPSPAVLRAREASYNSSANRSLSDIRALAVELRVSLRGVVQAIGSSIEKILEISDAKARADAVRGLEYRKDLDSSRVPDVSVGKFLWRIVDGLNARKEPPLFNSFGESLLHTPSELAYDDDRAMGRGLRCLLVSLIYVDRLSMRPDFLINSKNAHKVLLGCLFAALKFSDDRPGDLANFARIARVSMDELKKIELTVCALLQFDFFVSEIDFRYHCMHHLRLAIRSAHATKRLDSFSTSEERKTTSSFEVMSDDSSKPPSVGPPTELPKMPLPVNRQLSATKDEAAHRSRVDSVGMPYGLGGSTPTVRERKRFDPRPDPNATKSAAASGAVNPRPAGGGAYAALRR